MLVGRSAWLGVGLSLAQLFLRRYSSHLNEGGIQVGFQDARWRESRGFVACRVLVCWGGRAGAEGWMGVSRKAGTCKSNCNAESRHLRCSSLQLYTEYLTP